MKLRFAMHSMPNISYNAHVLLLIQTICKIWETRKVIAIFPSVPYDN